MSNTKKEITKTDVLAAYQVFGGLVGIGLTIYLITNQQFSILLLPIFFVAMSLYIFSIVCGIQIFRNFKLGLKLSRINQLMQVFGFCIGGYALRYVSGIDLSIILDFTESFTLTFSFATSAWHILINGDPAPIYFNINLVAILLVIFIDRQLKKLNDEENSERYEITGNGVIE